MNRELAKRQKQIDKLKQIKDSPSNNPAYISFRSYRRKHYLSTVVEDKAREEQLKRLLSTDIVLTSYFEIGKDFQRYFKKGNRHAVLSKVNQNEIKDFHAVNSKNMSM